VKSDVQRKIGSPRPNGERGRGVRGIPMLRQHTLAFPDLARLFGLGSGIDAVGIAPSPLAPLPRRGEGNEAV